MRRFLDWTQAGGSGINSQPNKSKKGPLQQQQQQGQVTPSSANKSQAANPAKDLELQHLIKLLHEIKYYQASSSPLPSADCSQNQRDFVDKIHNTLPLFLSVFGASIVQSFNACGQHPQQGASATNSLTYVDKSASQISLLDDWSQGGGSSSQSSKPSSPLPPISPQMDKFPDLLPFTFTIARLFVSEVRQRASDKHAEDASLAILQFLSSQQTTTRDKIVTDQQQHQAGQGWNLLVALNTLASSHSSQIIQLMCDASLPSTLIKCLYLFFDLPTKDGQSQESRRLEASADDATIQDASTSRDLTGTILIKAFTQLLIQLCSYQSAIDELIKKDDLRLLIGIASSHCAPQNRAWRKTAFLALLAISKNMRDNFIYLEQNICIQVYVENMHRINSLALATNEDLIDMIRVLIEFIYNLDVNNRNQVRSMSPVLEQYKSSRILELIEELMFTIDESIAQEVNTTIGQAYESDPLDCTASQQPSVSSEIGVCLDDYRRFGKCLVHSWVTMAKIFHSQESMITNTTLKPLAMSRFEMLEQFKMPRPTSRDCILNNEALRFLKMSWSKCKDPQIVEAVLDSTIQLFNDDKYNYFVFESQQLLVYYMTSANFQKLPLKLKHKLFKFLEFIIIETHYIPCLELGTLGTILRSKQTSDIDKAMILKTVIACLRFNSKFSDIFRDIGLMEVVIELLMETMQHDKLDQCQEKLEVLYLLLEASQYLLAGPNNANCMQFNESGAARHVFNCLSKPKFFHLFVPPHSSSSDDSGPFNNTSRTSTPTPTSICKGRLAPPMIQANYHWMEQGLSRAQARPSIKQMQKVAFTIIRQLVLSNAGDEHLANLLGLLARNIDDLKIFEDQDGEPEGDRKHPQSSQMDFTFLVSQEVNIKIYILKSLMIILKDSHRCRALFRKVGGFIYLVSALTSIERALPPYELENDHAIECHNRWTNINSRRIWRLIKNTLMTITVAMRSEPMNLRVFSDEVIEKFIEAVRRLGCFNAGRANLMPPSKLPPRTDHFDSFKSIFLSPPARDFSTLADERIKPDEACCQIFRFLYDMSLDMADGTLELEQQLIEESGKMFKGHQSGRKESKSISFDQGSSEVSGQGIYTRRSQLQKVSARLPSLDLNSCNSGPGATLTFPCIILCILDLVPSCPNEDLMIFIGMIVKSLFIHERNQQLLCEAGMISKLLSSSWRISITDKNHFLHNISEFMFEKLTKQSITPSELRMFLRIGEPLCCKNLDEIEVKESSSVIKGEPEDGKSKPEKISTSRMETLVAMMTDERSKSQPPFVEFDMSAEGCSSIFIPSIAPVNTKLLSPDSTSFLNSTLDVHTNEKNGILGGVGSTQRPFPPASGFTFSTWICVEKFPSRSSDPSHNIRLLTIYRGSAATGKEYSCLRLQVSALDRALTISTQESLLFDNDNRPDAQHDPDCFVRIWTPEILFEGRWHHIIISMRRSSARQGAVNVFIDGIAVHSQRICYINSYVGPINSGALGLGSGSNSPAAFVNAFIGALPQIRLQSSARWKQGPCHMIEEPLDQGFVSTIFSLGPNFIGNFQCSRGLKHLLRKRSIRGGDRGKHHSSDQESHKTLMHQQSAAVVQSARHGLPLTRVSSAGMASSLAYNQSNVQGQSLSIAEDKMLANLDARSTSLITLSRMRRIYTRFDCRQVSRFLGIAINENSTPLLLLHNAAIHLNGASRTIGAVTIGHDHVRCFIPNPTEQTLFSVGGCYVLIGLVGQSQSSNALYVSIKILVSALKSNSKLQIQMDNVNGYQILTVMFWKRKHLLTREILNLIFTLIVSCQGDNQQFSNQAKMDTVQGVRAIQQVSALRDLICECFDLWSQTNLINSVLEFIHELISSSDHEQQLTESSMNSTRTKNLKYLRDMDLLPRMLRLLPRNPQKDCESDTNSKMAQTFDAKAIYLIKQTVFELLNRTPRQSDILYFGQFLASLLPTSTSERPPPTINLRNVLLKSLLQMMTRNKQVEVNHAMQEELVRILGFDWFMLFVHGSHLDPDTITLGFLNLMILLSNDDLYSNFRLCASTNGGWLKEPIFPTMDGKFNIQMLGINYGVFFGLGGKRKAICQDIIDAPNFFLLTSCLRNLRRMPRIYLMLFQTMMGCLTQVNASVLDSIGSFGNLNLDALCDSLIGETHHKRRQTLSGIQFRSLELIVCLVYMIRDIMCELEPLDDQLVTNFPTEVIRFFMYLYNNNIEFQNYCRKSEELIEALCEALMNQVEGPDRRMTSHPASKEAIELSGLIIIDRMSESAEAEEIGAIEQLIAFERFLDALAPCREAQGELVDWILSKIILIIDSYTRDSSLKTISSSENVKQLQLLLANSITVAQIVADKIWSNELYAGNMAAVSGVIEHLLNVAEQIYLFHKVMPSHSPIFPANMQRALNRILLFALSRPAQSASDKTNRLHLLNKINNNNNLLLMSHVPSTQTTEFLVCLTYCLINIMDENVLGKCFEPNFQPSSPNERLHAHSMPGSTKYGFDFTKLMSFDKANQVWEFLYQEKEEILSEAFNMSILLPGNSLNDAPDLLQLRPYIKKTCEKYWNSFIDNESKPKRRLLPKSSEPTQGTASAAVNILSGRLTRVVNAANFVSRVVGATAGSMASNVNMVGEKLSQNRNSRSEMMPQRSPSDLTSAIGLSSRALDSQQKISNAASSTSQVSPVPPSRSSDLFKKSNLDQNQIQDANRTHITIIEDFIRGQTSQRDHKLALHKYLCDEWSDVEFECLLRERALFGPDYGSRLDKWCLDLTEGPRRMRKKMVNNTRQFYENYAYQPEQYNPSNKSLRYRPPMSYDSYLYYLKTLKIDRCLFDTLQDKCKTVEMIDGKQADASKAVDNDFLDVTQEPRDWAGTPTNADCAEAETGPVINVDSPSSVKSARQKNASSLESLSSIHIHRCNSGSPRPSEGDQDDGDSTSFVDFSPEIEAESKSENVDSLSVLRLLEKNERISHMFRCSRVQGLDTFEGLLLFGKEHFYLIDGFTLLKTREVRDIDSLPPDSHDPIIPNSTPNITAHSKKTCAKFSFESVVEVHKRRYLLQPIALEVFSSDGRNALIVFPRNIRNKVYSRLMQVATQITSNAHESLAGQKSNVSVEGGSGLLSNLMGDTSVTQRWIRGELSNFQYLMNLNTIAGRSYNDLMQYPIFPWILADYTSDCLDLNKPSTFRDLSRPIGAQTSERLEQFKRRFAEWDDNETPPYHYGTFYSSAMIVASYMVRMEPFTQHFLRLQGGHFDLADRMFHSINDSWMSASKHNMADIKELIPEFFYLPEFLKNENKYDLGIKQNGMKLDNVVLPPWAKGDAREFIRLHRCALESDFVSAHLHEWIDLIFGYKQQGQAAVDAVNVFHHLFYEGNVDIYNTDIDPIKKNAVIGFINNFGQVPKQLFKKAHPMRKVTNQLIPGPLPITPILPSLSSSSNSNVPLRSLTHCPQLLRLVSTNIKDLRGPVGQIVLVDKNVVAVEQNKLLIPPEYCRYVAWGHADRSLRLGLYDSDKPIYVWEGSDNMQPHEILCSTIPNSRTMITAGTESLITVWKIEKMRSITPITNLYGHVEPVTCLASSQSYSIIVSGSRDRTAIIWDLNRLTFVRQLGGGPPDQLLHHGPISAIAINDSTGDIATCASSWLYLWTINGELMAQVDSFSVAMQQSMNATASMSSNISQLHILSVCFSQLNEWDLDEVIVTGASDGSVSIWSMRYYQCPMTRAQLDAAKDDHEESKLLQQATAPDEQDSTLSDRGTTRPAKESSRESSTRGASADDELKIQESIETTSQSQPKAAPSSEPIEIIGTHRQRTDTMNSEWVRLSTSSISATGTPHILKVEPTSPADPPSGTFTSSEFLASGDSYTGDPGQYMTKLQSTEFDKKSVDVPRPSVRAPSDESLRESSPNGSLVAYRDAVAHSSAGNVSTKGEESGVKGPGSANLLTPNDPPLIKFSKSDTSLVESFVLLDSSSPGGLNRHNGPQARPQSSADSREFQNQHKSARKGFSGHNRANNKVRTSLKLLPDHCWRRELHLRNVLSRRQGKIAPAAVTSMTISKDAKNLYVGDARGRISLYNV